jgi:hypothetical protein
MKVCLLLALTLLTLNACQTHPKTNSRLAHNAATNSNRQTSIIAAPPAPNSGRPFNNPSLDNKDLDSLSDKDLSPEDEAE